MINQENIPDDYDDDGTDNGGNPVQPDERDSNQNPSGQNPSDLNPLGNDENIGYTSNYPAEDDEVSDNISNNDSVPSEIENDDVPEVPGQPGQDESVQFPGDDSNIGDNPVYPSEEDIAPRNNDSL